MNLSCKSEESPRVTLFQTIVSEPITLTIIVDSIPGKYVELIEIRDPFTNKLLECSESIIFQADSFCVELFPGAYNIVATDNIGTRYLFRNFKHSYFSNFCTICSDYIRYNNYSFGFGVDSLVIVNQIEQTGVFNYEITQLLFSTTSSNTWDHQFLPSNPVGYNDTLTFFFDMDEAPYDFMLFDQDYNQYLFNTYDKTINILHVNDDMLNNNEMQRNIYFINMVRDTIVSITEGFGSNLIQEIPIAPYDTSSLFAAYGAYSLQLEDCVHDEYIIPNIKCTELMGDIYIDIESSYGIDNDCYVSAKSLFIDSGSSFVNIVNLTNATIQSLTIRNTNNDSFVPLLVFSELNSLSHNNTMPVYLKNSDYELWCFFSDQSSTLLKTFTVGEDVDTTVVELFPSEITPLPARYSVGSGTSRIDIINGLLASSIMHVYLEPSSNSFWDNDISGAIFLQGGDTLSIFCESDKYDLLIVDSEGDTYAFWNTKLHSDSIYECHLSYEQSMHFIASGQINSTSLFITNDTPYELWFGYVREHGSFGWELTDIFPDDELITYRQTYQYPLEPGCYDLLVSSYNEFNDEIYYSQDSICITSSDSVNVTLTAANKTIIGYAPVEVDTGVYTVCEGSASIEIINQLNSDVYSIYLSPSNSPNWGDDRLGDELLLQSGEKLTIFAEPDTYDIKVKDSEYNEYFYWDVIVTDSVVIEVLPKTSLLVSGEFYDDYDSHFDSLQYPGVLPYIVFYNDLSTEIYHVYIRYHNQPEWGKNLLSYFIFNPDSRIILPVSEGCYDLRAEVRNSVTWDIVNVYELDSVTVSDSIEFVWNINEEHLVLP